MNTGWMKACFLAVETYTVLMDFLKSKVSAGAISCVTKFSRMLSGPAVLQGFKFCSRFLTPLMEVSMLSLIHI